MPCPAARSLVPSRAPQGIRGTGVRCASGTPHVVIATAASGTTSTTEMTTGTTGGAGCGGD